MRRFYPLMAYWHEVRVDFLTRDLPGVEAVVDGDRQIVALTDLPVQDLLADMGIPEVVA